MTVMTDDQQDDSAQDASLPFRITSHRDGEVLSTEWLSIGGVVSALLVFSVVSVLRLKPDGTTELVGIGTTIPFPVPDPENPGGHKVVVWSTPKILLREGVHRIFARVLPDDPVDTPVMTLNVRLPLGLPEMLNPQLNGTYDRDMIVSGRMSAGSTITDVVVKVFNDFGAIPIGQANVVGNGWSMPISFEPGVRSIVAQAYKGGAQSGRTGALIFKVRPLKLAVTVTPLSDNEMNFSGIAHTGAIVEITKVSGPGDAVVSPVEVVGGAWEVTATGWEPGEYRLSAIQKIPDNVGGWIPSLPFEFTFIWFLPQPIDVTYTVTDYTPHFLGSGYTDAKVCVVFSDESVAAPEAPVVGGKWSTTASKQWGPTNRQVVRLAQRLGDQVSGWALIWVTIPLLAPTITEIIENGMSPIINGICWPGAEVNAVFSDSPDIHPIISGATGNWCFERSTPFAPEVVHTVKVIQIFNGETSPEASKTFNVHKFLDQPIITEPKQDEEVGRDLIIHGEAGVAGATMTLRDAQFDRPLGEPKLLNEDGDWKIELKNLEFRKYTVDAIQAIGERKSLRSEYCFFAVEVLPPKIEVPTPGGDLSRESTISGKGMPRALVTVWLHGGEQPLLRDVPVNDEGHWEGNVRLPVGNAVIRARQTFEGRPSKDTPLLSFRVVPNVPYVETPAKDEQVGQQVVVSGFGYRGDAVKVMLADAPETLLGQGPVLEDRTWSVAVELDRSGGSHRLMVVQSRDGFDSMASERAILLGSYLPRIDGPKEGAWVTDPVPFEGKGLAGQGKVVHWFDPDQKLAEGIDVDITGWRTVANTPLNPGGHWVRFRQSLADEPQNPPVHSDWGESKRFEVAPSKPASE